MSDHVIDNSRDWTDSARERTRTRPTRLPSLQRSDALETARRIDEVRDQLAREAEAASISAEAYAQLLSTRY